MKNSLSLLVSISILCLSCTELVEVAAPKTELITSTVFNEDESALAAMAGVYGRLSTSENYLGGWTDGLQSVTSLSSDEFNFVINLVGIYENAIDPANSSIAAIWRTAYQSIYECNAILNGTASSVRLSPGVKNQLEGEAKFIRAFHYFHLVNLFGDVPLLTETDYQQNVKAGRTSSDLVYEQILRDLADAKRLLVFDFSYGNGQRIRGSHWSACALLARVYAYLQQWDDVLRETSDIIAASDLFGMQQDLESVFLANSQEAIWQLFPPVDYLNNAPEAYLNSYNASLFSVATLSDQLLAAFEPRDKRRLIWVASNMDYQYPNKYTSIKKGAPAYTEYSTVLRLAEQYLLRAEAKAHLGDIGGGARDLDLIRKRAGLQIFDTSSKTELLAVIERERRVELFSEFGHRWMDLKRWQRVGEVLRPIKPLWIEGAEWYPIPENELIKNPNLEQNKGY